MQKEVTPPPLQYHNGYRKGKVQCVFVGYRQQLCTKTIVMKIKGATS